MDTDVKVFTVIGILLLLGVAISTYNTRTQYNVIYEKSKNYPIYHCTAPFGIIWIEETTQGSFLFIVGSYRVSASLTESYNVKAFDGDELITKVFDATKVSVVPDGEFYLEELWRERIIYSRNGKILDIDDSRQMWGESDPIWIIHIPQLPSLNQTISMEWVFLDS